MDETIINFGDAFNRMLAGDRMTAEFLPENVFVCIRTPDEGSMNTQPYALMVTVAANKGENGEDLVADCVPWTPGSRSLFATTWKLSPYTGEVIAKNGARI